MTITKEAKEALEQLFAQYGANGLRLEMQQSCCGSSPVIGIDILEEGEGQLVDGVRFVCDKEHEPLMQDVILDVKDGELVVINLDEGSGCSGCSGCH